MSKKAVKKHEPKEDDPDEARLPECVRAWRELPEAARDGVDYEWPSWRTAKTGIDERTGYSAARLAEGCLEWLATAPPPAILLAASAADAEVLRAEQDMSSTRCRTAFERARILDTSTHVVLPRAEVEALLEKWRQEALEWNEDHDEADDGRSNEIWIGRQELRALLDSETGKGEG